MISAFARGGVRLVPLMAALLLSIAGCNRGPKHEKEATYEVDATRKGRTAHARGGAGRGEVGRRFEYGKEIATLLQEGDIVFRRGGGITGRAVLIADAGGVYSHAGIVVKTRNTDTVTCMVVHVVPGEEDSNGVRDVIKIESPELFFAPARALEGAAMRLRNDGAEVGREEVEVERVAAMAAKRAERLAATGIAFDHDYDLGDTVRMYCTELVWRVFEREGLDLTEGRRTKIALPGFRGDYILPTDISKNPKLETIYRFRY